LIVLALSGQRPNAIYVQAVVDQEVGIPLGPVTVAGSLSVPGQASGVVVFAHGSGSGRFSARNRLVAHVLFEAGFVTLLIDLLTPAEEAEDLQTARLRFDVRLLAERVIGAIDWSAADDAAALPSDLGSLPVGGFGASTGAAAALIAAAERRSRVAAVVSRGGRPDLAADWLPSVVAPTLLIVGANDVPVLDLNRRAQALLAGESQLEIVPGAGHLFEEPGALERVATLTRTWFLRHLAAHHRL
jgi:pimeloyl-ACP methyl ester carboxylesterase